MLILIEDAVPGSLAPLLRALLAQDPRLHVALRASEIPALPDGSTLLLRARVEDAVWLNLNRPLFARKRLRVVLWSPPGVLAPLRAGAPDFFDWISHIVPCTPQPLSFIVAGLHAAPARPGIAWRGPVDPLETLRAVFPERTTRLVDLPRRTSEAVAILRDARPGWLVWENLTGPRALVRLQRAAREAGRTDVACVLADPPFDTPGWWPLDTTTLDWADGAARLHASDPHDAALRSALLELEPGALDLWLALRAGGVDATDLDTPLRSTLDPGAALARIAHDRGMIDLRTLPLRQAAPCVLRGLVDRD